jgi:hypothetical protein
MFDKSNIDSSTLNNKTLALFLKMIQHILSPKLFPSVEKTIKEESYSELFTQNLLIIQTFILKSI